MEPGRGLAERGLARGAVRDPPVLSVRAAVLGNIEPDQPEGAVVAHAGEQAGDLGGLAGQRAGRGLGQQYPQARGAPALSDGRPEDAVEVLGRAVIVTVDTHPGDVLPPGPPRGDRPGPRLVSL